VRIYNEERLFQTAGARNNAAITQVNQQTNNLYIGLGYKAQSTTIHTAVPSIVKNVIGLID